MASAASYDAIRAALEAQWHRLITAFAATDPAQPSRLPGWTVANLESHLARTGKSLGVLAAAPPAHGQISGIQGWAGALPGLAERIAGDATSGSAPSLAEMVPTVLTALRSADPARPVAQSTGVHRLRDATLFRLIEAVVHGLDLPDRPAADRNAQRIVVRALADLLASLAPGRSVELRIPPAAVVQLIEGPRHTRGNPPGVVETDPITFLQLATGRATWAEAFEVGRLRASGERTDLSAYLPLLR